MKGLMGVVLAATALATAAPAAAAGAGGVWTTLSEHEQVFAPRGFQNLCETRPEFCVDQQVEPEVSRVMTTLGRMFGEGSVKQDAPELTAERLRTLERVNLAVNHSIHPTADHNGDIWSFSAIAGDCEEYVLMKREVLARLGWPRSAMRIAVVSGAEEYAYHAVLVVTTRGGEFVLDNLTDALTRVEHSPYEFVVTQSFERPGAWVRVRADNAYN